MAHNMKRYFCYLILLCGLCLVGVSCGDNDDEPAPAPSITVVRNDLHFGAKGGEGYVELLAGAQYQVSSSSAWCTALVDGSVIRVTVTDNDGFEGRTAILTITSSDGGVLELPVQQRGIVLGTLPVSSVFAPNAGLRIAYHLPHDLDVEISADQPWLRGEMVGDSVVISADPNAGGHIRRAQLTLMCAGVTDVLKVAQYSLKDEVLGNYTLANPEVTMGTTVCIFERNDSIFMRFTGVEEWKDVPVDFDRGDCKLIFHSAMDLNSKPTSSDSDTGYFYDSSANRIATSADATMVARLQYYPDRDIVYCPLEDGGTWHGFKLDGFLIRTSRAMGTYNVTLMNINQPFLLRMSGLEE